MMDTTCKRRCAELVTHAKTLLSQTGEVIVVKIVTFWSVQAILYVVVFHAVHFDVCLAHLNVSYLVWSDGRTGKYLFYIKVMAISSYSL